MMLVRGSSEYISQSQGHALLDLYPVNKVDEQIPSPRVLNTHYRLDVLPSQFRGRKTVIGMWVTRSLHLVHVRVWLCNHTN